MVDFSAVLSHFFAATIDLRGQGYFPSPNDLSFSPPERKPRLRGIDSRTKKRKNDGVSAEE
jgi:hypothetical protein